MPTRKSLRYGGWDYRDPAAYFVTICAAVRGRVFGRLVGDAVILNPVGTIVARHLNGLDDSDNGVVLDASIVMPDHVHAVVVLEERKTSLGAVIAAFKSRSGHEARTHRRDRMLRLWQRGYYDHVVRDDDDLDRVREYIETNPARTAAR